MGKDTKIQWTNKTWNPWQGCEKVSPGCKYCYMYRDKEKYGQDPYTPVRTSDKTFFAPLGYKEPALIFTCSWSDFFIEQADQWRGIAWEVIKATPHLTYQILTKRPERILECLPSDWGEGYPNVWLGTSVENQKMYDLRVPIIIEVPAKVKFLSIEPLIGGIRPMTQQGSAQWMQKIDWVIIGGESGNDKGKYLYRPCELEWIGYLFGAFAAAGVPVFIKQLGTHLAKELELKDRSGGNIEEWEGLFNRLPFALRAFPKNYSIQ